MLDVGGRAYNWTLITARPQITFLNIIPPKENEKHLPRIIADARHLPFKNAAFDILYSNSVIEHLGTLENQQAMANECVRVGQRVYVQTPNRHFFIEPHLITPFIHWLPRSWQRKLLHNFTTWGLITRPSQAKCDHFLDEVHLLTRHEMRRLFPNIHIWQEQFLVWTKSFTAIKLNE
ncbi:MAG TPA: methyltransferase domain-containing protein [Anaerolineales bacterium]|nr:methyltransferase domain-containing protein [Anaerolineales bacterium]